MKKLILLLTFITSATILPQTDTILVHKLDSLLNYNASLEHRLDVLEKNIDDIVWFQKLGDVAYVDKIFMTGPPKWKETDTTDPAFGNPVKFWSYVFIPKDIDFSKKYPLIVFPHSGVRKLFDLLFTHSERINCSTICRCFC